MAVLGLFQERPERGDTERHLQTEEVVQDARRAQEKPMKEYRPRICEICGKEYIPRRSDQRTCGSEECMKKRQRLNQLEYRERNYAKVLADNRRAMKERREKKRRKEKPDTLVAIGYAERQMAETLKMAGRVNTEL